MQRGRKSSASKAVLALLPGQRPEPPHSLTKPQAEIWREVAATKPQDWFSRDTYALLIAYCRHVDTANLLAAQINVIDLGDKRLPALLRMRALETTIIVKLSTAMRLTQHSRYDAAKASVASRSGTPASDKPWQQQAD